MTFTPYPWQEKDLAEIEAHNFVAFINIEVGGGKTLLATWSIERSGAKRVLIIAPDQTHKTAWIPTIREVLGVEARVIGNTGKDKKSALFDFSLGYDGIFLATPQFLTRADISEWSGDMCVIDEGHSLNRKGGAGQRKLSGVTFKEWEQSLSAKFPMRLFLSGTAWRNDFSRAWATCRFLFPEREKRGDISYLNYWLWCNERMTSEEVYIGGYDRDGRPRKAKKWLNEAEPGRLVSEMPCVIIHKRWETCCDDPTHQGGFLNIEKARVTTHRIELHPKQKKAIKELETSYMAWLEDNPLIVDLPITLAQRLRQVCLGVPTLEYEEDEDGEVKTVVSFEENCVSPFADELIRLLEELDGENVVVWMSSQKFAEVLTKRLNKNGFKAFEYSGKTKDTRDADLEKFGTEYQVMVAIISAAGTGTDGLYRKAATSVWLESDVDMTNNVQADGRLTRMGAQRREDKHVFVDDLGYASGRISDQLEKQLALAKTLRKV